MLRRERLHVVEGILRGNRQCGELFDMAGEERIAADHEPARFWSEV